MYDLRSKGLLEFKQTCIACFQEDSAWFSAVLFVSPHFHRSPAAGSRCRFLDDLLWRFRNKELQHFKLAAEAMHSIGADPTAQSPCADADGLTGTGLIQVFTDPRTSITQCLEALLIGQLTDNAARQPLIEFAEKMGMDEMAQSFGVPLLQEEIHLAHVASWHRQMVLRDAGIEP